MPENDSASSQDQNSNPLPYQKISSDILAEIEAQNTRQNILKELNEIFISRLKNISINADADSRDKEILSTFEQMLLYLEQFKSSEFHNIIPLSSLDETMEQIKNSAQPENSILWISEDFFNDLQNKLKSIILN